MKFGRHNNWCLSSKELFVEFTLFIPCWGSFSRVFGWFIEVDAMELPSLNAYLDSVGLPNFGKGCNFAAAGSTILKATASSIYPFTFGIQVSQFLRFKARSLELLAKSICFILSNIFQALLNKYSLLGFKWSC